MRLIKLKLKNFRRFGGEHALDLNEDLVALVGPNEAGKSSILRALDLVGRLERPAATDATRGSNDPAELKALFVLDDDDRALLTEIHDGDKVTHVWVTLRSGDGPQIWGPEPRPSRDLGPRAEAAELLQAIADDPALDPIYATNEDLQWNRVIFDDVVAVLDSGGETLDAEAISWMDSLAARLLAIHYEPDDDREDSEVEPDRLAEDEQRATTRAAAAAALVDLVRTEQEPTPVRLVIDALDGRTPDVAFFGEDDRDLRSSYTLDEIAGGVPAALAHICALGEINLDEIRVDIAEGRAPHVEALFEAANLRLREKFRETWRQSDIYPRLSTPLDGVMRIMVAVDGGGDYSFPEERSDGLRWFMALHAFLISRGQTNPILLVDEAETHLHYDAQADLVDALMNQRVARQVIYTTHSVGCLPPDLGCGIRVVLAKEDAERSAIANSYWSVEPSEDQKVGYTPLLFGMGARLLALTIPRYGVLVEGPADAILLPTLLREVAPAARLPYRVAPGLADVAGADVQAISAHAGAVACLADGDEGGLAICAKLRDGGIAPATIFHLGDVAEGCTLEDLVTKVAFTAAVNRELDTWGIGPFRVSATELPETGRWAWLLEQGAETGTPVHRLSKPRVAQRVVDARHDSDAGSDSVVDPAVAEALRELHDKLCAVLGLVSDRSS